MKNQTLKLAFDLATIDKTSVRSYDAYGRLHVELTRISKAMVCPYYGHEIPDSEKLGLDQNKVYQLFRDPVELQRAAGTFNNIQLLEEHTPIDADEPKREMTIGSLGTDAVFKHPYLMNSLVVWDAKSIAGIESEQIQQLSIGYGYTADMTSGEYQGQAYDGVMRNIVGNHITPVERGRAGPDVVVADKDPFFNPTLTEGDMKRAEKRKLKIAQDGAVKQIAQDAGITDDAIAKLTNAFVLAMDAYDEDEEEMAKDETEEEAEEMAEEEDDEDAKKDEDTKKDDKPAMDAAFVDKKVKMAIDANNRMHQALKDVEPLVGIVMGMDSAEAVYKFALNQANVETAGVHPSAYKALVSMHKTNVSRPEKRPAMDREITTAVVTKFPAIKRFGG